MNGVWITWESQRRNIGISSALNFPLQVIENKSNRLIRYLKSIFTTYKYIQNKSPDIVIAQNPSIVLASFIIIYSRIGKYLPVLDAHNSGIYPMEGKSKVMMLVARWLQRHAALTIVTNEFLKNHVEENGGHAYVLQDAVPSTPHNEKTQLSGINNIVSICTYSDDEPYLEIIESAKSISKDIHIYITGNHKGRINTDSLPNNVHLTGYLPEDRYWELLKSSDIIMDLTYRENCLVCGAYEAVALEKPLILSNTRALKTYFHKGCTYTEPSAENIAQSIEKTIAKLGVLQGKTKELKDELNIEWHKKSKLLLEKLNLLATNRSG